VLKTMPAASARATTGFMKTDAGQRKAPPGPRPNMALIMPPAISAESARNIAQPIITTRRV
jgi:hypothetical protein